MTIMLKMKGGTPVEGESLCHSCRSAHIQKGFRESEETVFCNWDRLRVVTFKVAECTDYANRNVPYRGEMEKMALLINVAPTRKPAGFTTRAGFAAFAEDEDDCVSAME